jgi:hypothetical protein
MGLHYSEKFVYCLDRSNEIHGISNEIEKKIVDEYKRDTFYAIASCSVASRS